MNCRKCSIVLTDENREPKRKGYICISCFNHESSERSKKWYHANIERCKEVRKAYQQTDSYKKYQRKYAQLYYAKHKDDMALQRKIKRAKERNQVLDMPENEFRQIVREYFNEVDHQ
jgi:hypothetical protein